MKVIEKCVIRFLVGSACRRQLLEQLIKRWELCYLHFLSRPFELYALLCEVESTLVLDGSKYERVEKNVRGTV